MKKNAALSSPISPPLPPLLPNPNLKTTAVSLSFPPISPSYIPIPFSYPKKPRSSNLASPKHLHLYPYIQPSLLGPHPTSINHIHFSNGLRSQPLPKRELQDIKLQPYIGLHRRVTVKHKSTNQAIPTFNCIQDLWVMLKGNDGINRKRIFDPFVSSSRLGDEDDESGKIVSFVDQGALFVQDMVVCWMFLFGFANSGFCVHGRVDNLLLSSCENATSLGSLKIASDVSEVATLAEAIAGVHAEKVFSLCSIFTSRTDSGEDKIFRYGVLGKTGGVKSSHLKNRFKNIVSKKQASIEIDPEPADVSNERTKQFDEIEYILNGAVMKELDRVHRVIDYPSFGWIGNELVHLNEDQRTIAKFLINPSPPSLSFSAIGTSLHTLWVFRKRTTGSFRVSPDFSSITPLTFFAAGTINGSSIFLDFDPSFSPQRMLKTECNHNAFTFSSTDCWECNVDKDETRYFVFKILLPPFNSLSSFRAFLHILWDFRKRQKWKDPTSSLSKFFACSCHSTVFGCLYFSLVYFPLGFYLIPHVFVALHPAEELQERQVKITLLYLCGFLWNFWLLGNDMVFNEAWFLTSKFRKLTHNYEGNWHKASLYDEHC